MRPSARRKRRWLVVIGLAVLLLIGSAFTYVRVKLEGPDLGDKLASFLNKRMRGRIEIGSIEWPTSSLEAVATGGWVPVTVRNVKVWDDCALSSVSTADPDELRTGDPNEDCTPDDRPDPDPTSRRKPRKLLLDAKLLTAEIDAHAAMFGRHDLVFRKIWVHGGEALLEQTREPYPLHAYDRTIVSIITAFYPRMKAGFRAGIYADAPPPIFDLRDIHVENLNLTVHMAPYDAGKDKVGYGMTARIEGVNADVDPSLLAKPDHRPTSFLHMNAIDPLVAKFYVRLALHTGHARVRILDEGPRAAFHIPGSQGLGDEWAKARKAEYELQLAEIKLNRLAQLPTDWSRKDYVANTLQLDLEAHTIPCKTEGAGEPRREDGADLHLTGELLEYWDRPYDGSWNLDLGVKNLGPTLRTCIKSTLGGDNLGGTIGLRGPFVANPRVELNLHDLDVDVPLSQKEEPLRLTLAEVHGAIDLVNEQGFLEKTKALVRGGQEPGEVMLSANFGVHPYNATASIDITKPLDVGRFLPPRVAASVGHFLGGKLTARGDADFGFELADFDLTLGMTPTEKIIHVHKGRVFTNNDFDRVEIQKVAIEAGASHAVFDGWVDTVKETLNITIDGHFPDLDMWLRRLGLPQFAKSAGGGTVTITGPLKTPTIATRLKLEGVPCLGTVDLDAQQKEGVLTVNHISSAGLGGKLDGHGTVVLDDTPLIQKFVVEGQKLEAGKLCGLAGTVKGTLDTINVEVANTRVDKNRAAVDWLNYVKLYAKAPHLEVQGDAYSDISLCINRADDAKLCRPVSNIAAADLTKCEYAKGHTGTCAVIAARRDAGGSLTGTIVDEPARKTGRQTIPRGLAGAVVLDDLPMAAIESIVGKGNAGGLVSATLNLTGNLEAPQANGTIYLTHAWLGNAFVGDTLLHVDALDVSGRKSVYLHGDALVNQLNITATLGTKLDGTFPMEAAITGRRVEVDQFMDLTRKLGLAEPLQAWASGTLTIHADLVPGKKKTAGPEAWLEMTELSAILNHRSRDGRLNPIRFELVPGAAGQYAMSLRVTPQTIELACRNPSAAGGRTTCPARLDTPAGIVTIEGNATASQMNLLATGTLDLRRLGPLLENQVESIDGQLDLKAAVTGTFDAPTYEIGFEIKDQNPVSVRLAGGDATIQVLPGGQIMLANGALGFNSVTVNVRDQHREQQGELHVAGSIGLDGLKPVTWGVLIDGKIAGKMLQALAPTSFSQASGLVRIDGALSLYGKGELPLVRGTLTFDPDSGTGARAPLSVIPRGVRREIAVLGGSVEIDTTTDGVHRTYTLDVDDNPVIASIDGEGKLQHITGHAVLRDGVPQSAMIDLDAENIPFRIPGTLDLILSAKDIRLELPQGRSAWAASGHVVLVSGQYSRNFELTEAIKPAPPTVAPAKPFWDEYPSLGNADLNLTLDVRRFAVVNNITGSQGIELEGPNILIAGSPKDPRLSGGIRVLRGEFKIPATRAKFTRTTGSIDFTPLEPATNPTLNIQSDADYLDLSGQEHIISLSLYGTLEQPLWDLKTNTGLDKSQTLALLFLGRNPEQLRRSLGDSSLGADPTRVDPTTNPSAGFADQVVKDLAGDWVSDLLGTSLTRLTGLDILRFEVGFGSFGIHGEKKLIENVKLLGDLEQTVRGQTLNGRVEWKIPKHLMQVITKDRISVQGGYLSKNFYDPAEQDIQDWRGTIVYRLFIP